MINMRSQSTLNFDLNGKNRFFQSQVFFDFSLILLFGDG